MNAKHLLALFRIENLPKNLLWFMMGAIVPLSQQLRWDLLALALLSYFSVWFFAYTLNDYIDIADDKKHKRKKSRPLASGKIDKEKAKKLMIYALVFSLVLALIVSFYYFIIMLAIVTVSLFYNTGPYRGRDCYSFAFVLLWLMQYLKIGAGFLSQGNLPTAVPFQVYLFLALPTFYIFTYHYYWKDAKRFKNLKLGKIVSAALAGLLFLLFLIYLPQTTMGTVLLALLLSACLVEGLSLRKASFERRFRGATYLLYLTYIILILVQYYSLQ